MIIFLDNFHFLENFIQIKPQTQLIAESRFL